MLLQIELNSKKTSDCHVENNQMVPCGYHKDRVFNTPYEISANIIEKIDFNNGRIKPSAASKELATKFLSTNHPPAGSWFLVKEQRLWLKNTLKDIFISNFSEGDSVTILEAGVASFIHHFTYVAVLKRVLEELPFTMNIDLVVTDKCSFPLLCIDYLLGNWQQIKKEKMMNISGYIIDVEDEFIDFMDREILFDFSQIKTTTIEGDLTKSSSFLSARKCYDIVTEHFVTSVIENYEFVERIRSNYNNIIRDGGFLLCACGVNRSQGRLSFNKFIDLHEQDNSFLLEKEELSWDPYGMKREDILKVLEDQEVNVTFGNTLFKFQKIKNQKGIRYR